MGLSVDIPCPEAAALSSHGCSLELDLSRYRKEPLLPRAGSPASWPEWLEPHTCTQAMWKRQTAFLECWEKLVWPPRVEMTRGGTWQGPSESRVLVQPVPMVGAFLHGQNRAGWESGRCREQLMGQQPRLEPCPGSVRPVASDKSVPLPEPQLAHLLSGVPDPYSGLLKGIKVKVDNKPWHAVGHQQTSISVKRWGTCRLCALVPVWGF